MRFEHHGDAASTRFAVTRAMNSRNDGDHLSDYGSRMLLPSFREFMARVTANRVLAASP